MVGDDREVAVLAFIGLWSVPTMGCQHAFEVRCTGEMHVLSAVFDVDAMEASDKAAVIDFDTVANLLYDECSCGRVCACKGNSVNLSTQEYEITVNDRME